MPTKRMLAQKRQKSRGCKWNSIAFSVLKPLGLFAAAGCELQNGRTADFQPRNV